MDGAELALRRSQMGRSCLSFVAKGTRSVGHDGPGYWIALSGAPSPDVNVALLDTPDPAVAAQAVALVEQAGFPALIVLAGRSVGTDPGGIWQPVGTMPFMASSLTDEHLRPDSRVREAEMADFDAIGGLLAEAFQLDSETAEVIAQIIGLDDEATKIYLLVEDSVPVSTVLSSMVDDAVCIWCMATPARFARRGYARALLADVLSRARAAGSGIGLLGATPAGKPLYEATGWTVLEDWQVLTNAASEQFKS